MIRRFNYTGRKRIVHQSVQLTVSGSPDRELKEIDWDLSEMGFPDESEVYLEATSSGTPAVVRIFCGTVGSRKLPPATGRSLRGLA